MRPAEDERELRNEVSEDTQRRIQVQQVEEAMTRHWERAYGDE